MSSLLLVWLIPCFCLGYVAWNLAYDFADRARGRKKCRKFPYRTEAEATSMFFGSNTRMRTNHAEFCATCSAWHVTIRLPN